MGHFIVFVIRLIYSYEEIYSIKLTEAGYIVYD